MILLDYIQGAELPDVTLTWRQADGTPIPFATDHTFQLRVGQPGQPAFATKTTGITGHDTEPNITLQWSTTDDLNQLPAGRHRADLIATRTTDDKQRILRLRLHVRPAIQ